MRRIGGHFCDLPQVRTLSYLLPLCSETQHLTCGRIISKCLFHYMEMNANESVFLWLQNVFSTDSAKPSFTYLAAPEAPGAGEKPGDWGLSGPQRQRCWLGGPALD